MVWNSTCCWLKCPNAVFGFPFRFMAFEGRYEWNTNLELYNQIVSRWTNNKHKRNWETNRKQEERYRERERKQYQTANPILILCEKCCCLKSKFIVDNCRHHFLYKIVVPIFFWNIQVLLLNIYVSFPVPAYNVNIQPQFLLAPVPEHFGKKNACFVDQKPGIVGRKLLVQTHPNSPVGLNRPSICGWCYPTICWLPCGKFTYGKTHGFLRKIIWWFFHIHVCLPKAKAPYPLVN